MNNNITDYTLPRNAYATFDALSLKQLFIDRLKASNVFGDQSFEGNNFNAVLDVVASMYHILLFYLNQTSSETLFSQTSLYENMNKMVSILGYKPLGRQTSLVNFDITAGTDISTGIYTIKRFSGINVDGIQFTLLDDIVFEKTIAAEESVVLNDPFIYQGSLIEYPTYTANGEAFETVFITYDNFVDTNDERFVSDNTFRIFVQRVSNGLWEEWKETPSLFFNNSHDQVFEKRLNENGRFEIKFGNGITGKALSSDDKVAIYFILSDADRGIIKADLLQVGQLLPFSSSRFSNISQDIYSGANLLTNSGYRAITLNNANPSNPVTEEENVADIRKNSPLLFTLQNRLVTVGDYEAFISKTYPNIIQSVRTINNQTFISEYLKYFYEVLHLTKPNDNSRFLLNQVEFQTGTNFNNVYGFIVPKLGVLRSDNTPLYVAVSQKQLISDEVSRMKVCTQEFVPMDPVYMGFDIGLDLIGERIQKEIADTTYIVLKRSRDVQQSKEYIKRNCLSIIEDYFAVSNCSLGQVVSLQEMSNDILSIPGVNGITTRRTGGDGREVSGLSFVVWNYCYPNLDIDVSQQNIQLKFFQFPFLYNNTLSDRIIVEDE